MYWWSFCVCYGSCENSFFYFNFTMLSLLNTHADGIVTWGNHPRLYVRDSVCLSVCTINQNGWNCNHQTCHRDSTSRVLAHQLILGQKVKNSVKLSQGQGHRVTKCKTYWRRSSGWREFAPLSSAHPLVVNSSAFHFLVVSFLCLRAMGLIAWNKTDVYVHREP